MPTFLQSISEQDLGQLHIIAELWGFELSAPDRRQGRSNLASLILDHELVAEIIESLEPDAVKAIEAIQINQNRLPWLQFVHQYGEVREMGAGKRDREAPYRNPKSISEILWYRAIVARAFLETPDGPKEFAYIPEDLAALIPIKNAPENIFIGRPATKSERAIVHPASDSIVDHTCSLLAALRIGFSEEEIQQISENWSIDAKLLKKLLFSSKLLDKDNQPIAEVTGEFLQLGRGESLLFLYDAWLNSSEISDLHQSPDFIIEGKLLNRPLQTRINIFSFLNKLEKQIWWSLPSFVAAIKKRHPDFQRVAGEYDSWYIRDKTSGEYVRGIENWDMVEGKLIRYILTEPMHYLGLIDLANVTKDGKATSFRFSKFADRLINAQIPKVFESKDEKLHVDSKLQMLVPKYFPRSLRYQISRFCEWEGLKKESYSYRITSKSLSRALSQGLRSKQLLAILKKNASAKLPPNLVKALERWDLYGNQAKMENALVLRVKQPEILENLKKSRAARFLLEPLGPTAVIVKPGAWEKVMEALGEMGYLCEEILDI